MRIVYFLITRIYVVGELGAILFQWKMKVNIVGSEENIRCLRW